MNIKRSTIKKNPKKKNGNEKKMENKQVGAFGKRENGLLFVAHDWKGCLDRRRKFLRGDFLAVSL